MDSKSLFKNYIYPIAVLSGSVIGVGFLALPYIALSVGMYTMLFYFALLTALIVWINLIFAQISLKTPDFKRFPGFVGFYLGAWAERVTLVSLILGTFGVLLAYLIVGGQFLATIFSINPFYCVLLYFFVLSAITYFDIKVISKIEFWALCILLISLCIIFIKGFSKIDLHNIFPSSFVATGDWKLLFLPYGAIIFSLWGTGLIPEVEEMLRGRKKTLKKIVVISTLIPAGIYLAFTLMVLGISGSATTDSALIGLKNFLSPAMFLLALFVGVLSTFMGFVTNAFFLKKIFIYDMKIKKNPAWILTCFVPLTLFLLGLNSFIPLISFIGGVFLGINGIFILMMYQKVGGNRVMVYPLWIVFILGIIYEVVYFLK